MPASSGAEYGRLREVPEGRAPWRHWGPYLSERAWGTVREDYSPDGSAWTYFPHDHARSRAYRWNEDGLAGICDDRQALCLAFAFWNGEDPILKERLFGLAGPEGNHGEDVKEYWWYLDSTPTHSWMRWRYMYPQAAFPYADLVRTNAARGRLDPEYELVDTGVFADGRYWEITLEFAKASPEDVLVRALLRNAGPQAADIQFLPTLWFRNTWSWGREPQRPSLQADGATGVAANHWELGRRVLVGSGAPELLFCENVTNVERLYGVRGGMPYPKDGINDHVVSGAATVNPALSGTKAALRYRLSAQPGETVEVYLRLAEGRADLADDFDQVMDSRQREADEFYAQLTPRGTSSAEAEVMRQAFAGMLWSKQHYHYIVEQWLDGDPGQPPPPPERREGRNSRWTHLDNRDVISMPDKWEYPWYASWDLAFHCVTLAHVDPEFAKAQLLLLCREWYMHPEGQLPAYEWSFDDVNPPVHAWAALRVHDLDGGWDHDFLERVFHKLLLNFTWWVNRKDAEENNVFEGGFLGLDNIGPFDRSQGLPVPGHLQQSDGTAWMATYCLSLLEVALRLAMYDDTYEDIATKFFEHFTLIALAMDQQGLWDEQDGFYYDVLHPDAGGHIPVRARSLVGLIPLCAVTVLEPEMLEKLPNFAQRMDWYVEHRPDVHDLIEHMHRMGMRDRQLVSVVSPERLRRVLGRMLDETEFLSTGGIRSLSRYHAEHPLQMNVGGAMLSLDYEPAESRSGLFGGNSNWRGPVWFPLNYLLFEALQRFYACLGDSFTVECPVGSGRQLNLDEVARELSGRLIGLFLERPDGSRPVFGGYTLFQQDAAWHDLIPFHEYFHGDTGAGLGASHQTGWTGLVAHLIASR
ncbi:MAG TPA: glucosidase [Candidatus Dormibacteraeota bacterium]